MTWLQWVVGGLVVLAFAAVGLTAVAEYRWAREMTVLQKSLEAGRLEGKPSANALPTRYDAQELEGLPAPVQRYLRTVLKDGQPIITAVTIELAGTFNLSPTGQQWKPFTSRQRVVTRRPGFLWDAKIKMLPGVNVRVIDSYIVGKGLLHAAIQGLFTMVMAPWEGVWSNYQVRDGLPVPITGEVAWMRPEGRKPYFIGMVTALDFEFSP